MWYFTWILGLGLAVAFGLLNGIWHEFHLPQEDDDVALASIHLRAPTERTPHR